MACAECLQSPDFHLSETLATKLSLTSKRLLRDERIRTDATGVHLILYHVTEFEEVSYADSGRLVELFSCLTIIKMC